jgi:hypothetical protein
VPLAPPYWGRAPVSPALHQARNTARPRSTTHQHRRNLGAAAATVRADPVAQAVVAQAVVGRAVPGPADLAITVPAVLVTTDPADPADPAVLATTDPADPVGLVTMDQVDQAITDLVAPEGGTATTTAATSTAPRGVTDPRLGVAGSRHGRTGAGRFPRQEGVGTTDQLITTATTRTRSGTRVSTSGASISSECGSRCKDSPHRNARFAD